MVHEEQIIIMRMTKRILKIIFIITMFVLNIGFVAWPLIQKYLAYGIMIEISNISPESLPAPAVTFTSLLGLHEDKGYSYTLTPFLSPFQNSKLCSLTQNTSQNLVLCSFLYVYRLEKKRREFLNFTVHSGAEGKLNHLCTCTYIFIVINSQSW